MIERERGAGYTPLHMAVGYSHVAVAAALLEAGADPEVRCIEAAHAWFVLHLGFK